MKKLYPIFKLCTPLLALILIADFLPQPVFANGAMLKISPSVIQIQTKPPADIWAPFIIENQSNESVSLQIGYKPFNTQASSNGTVVYLKNGEQIPGSDKDIYRKMQIVDQNDISQSMIALGPKQAERFRLHIALPKNEPTSDYYFSLIFLENNLQLNQTNQNVNIENQKSYSSLQLGTGTDVLLAVGDKETPQGAIDTFSSPLFLQNGSVPFSLSVHNSGTHFISPYGTILIKNIFGQTVGKINLPKSVILAGTNRSFTDVNWSERFILGFYTATLTLALSPDGPTYTRTVNFIAFPLVTFAIILAIIGGCYYMYRRIKKKLF